MNVSPHIRSMSRTCQGQGDWSTLVGSSCGSIGEIVEGQGPRILREEGARV